MPPPLPGLIIKELAGSKLQKMDADKKPGRISAGHIKNFATPYRQ